jgi:Protein of unknown function (DUF5818)
VGRTKMFAAAVVLAVSPLLLGQDTAIKSSPVPPAEILGSPLIVWSESQKPQPVPIDAVHPDQQSQDQRAIQPMEPDRTHSGIHELQNFTGTIVNAGSRYVLILSSEVVYQVDDQEKARAYEGKRVRISGNLDSGSSVVRVISMELDS